jgi:hypothetical protein
MIVEGDHKIHGLIHPASRVLALLEKNTPVCFKAGGPSMTPSLRDGETVQVRPIRPRDIRCGTLFLYQAHGRLVLHRMIRCNRKAGYAWMTGDAALSGTEKIPLTALAGTAQWVLRDGKKLRLDNRYARWLGLARFALRPLRRLVLTHCHRTRT